MRTFEYQDDKSSKFWKISIEDCTHTVNYGKTGTSGRTQSKSFNTPEEAKKSSAKLIEQKIKKGYIEVEIGSKREKINIKNNNEGLKNFIQKEQSNINSKNIHKHLDVDFKYWIEEKVWMLTDKDEARKRVENYSGYSSVKHRPIVNIETVLDIKDADLMIYHARRLKFFLLRNSDHLLSWLAHTKYKGLDIVCRSILNSYNQGQLLKVFSNVIKAPEVAPYMLELWLASKAPSIARQWLDDNPVHAIIGLIPVATGQLPTPPVKVNETQMTRAAIDFLISLKRKGYEDLIQQAIENEPQEVVEIITNKILENEDLHEPLDDRNTPQWLKQRVDEIRRKQKIYNVFSWVTPADLPPLVIQKNCFNESQTNACLVALSKSTLDSPHPFLKEIKDKCDRTSIDKFVWSLFERWLLEDAPSKEKWAMFALGLLGSDEIAIKFTPYIRKWPGESQHHRAVYGLQCLRAIGSDIALMQINGIAKKVKYKGLKARANECLQAIAKARKLSPEELEDRIIPDLGLDEKGKRVFDFGDRQFHFALGQDLKPMVRDEKGKLKANLPKPAKKDNEELATQAISDWKLLKKQIREVIKIQTLRLEQGMTSQRRWQWQDFENLLVKHPFMIHLVQRIIWAGYDDKNNLIHTFRIAEDYTYADAQDEEITLEKVVRVGIVHPIHLSQEEKMAWGETLSDYEIIPPFAQIDRDIYTITPEEANEIEIKRFQNIEIESVTLGRTMDNLSWLKGGLHDHGDFCVHYKYFPHADITAITGDYECQHVAMDSIWGNDAIDGCLFVRGEAKQPYEYPAPNSWYVKNKYFKGEHILLKDVDILVMSEVLRDLYTVTAKQASKN